MITKITSKAMLVTAGILLSVADAGAVTIYGNIRVNGVTYNISPYGELNYADLHNANLSGADLKFTTLNNANLTNTNLSNSDLAGVTIYFADLTNANLSNTIMTTVSATFANLTNANLSNSDLSWAGLFYANLTNVNLLGANLTGTSLYGARVSYKNWQDFYTNSGATGLDNYVGTEDIVYAGSAAVPEPSTYGLIGLGALGLAFAARRRKAKTV